MHLGALLEVCAYARYVGWNVHPTPGMLVLVLWGVQASSSFLGVRLSRWWDLSHFAALSYSCMRGESVIALARGSRRELSLFKHSYFAIDGLAPVFIGGAARWPPPFPTASSARKC